MNGNIRTITAKKEFSQNFVGHIITRAEEVRFLLLPLLCFIHLLKFRITHYVLKMSRSVSRVLSWTVIYLDAGLLQSLKPLFVAHRANVQLQSALLRIGFTGFRRSRETGELLPRLSTLTAKAVQMHTQKKLCGGISLLHFP